MKSCLLTVFDPPPRGEDYTILQALLSLDMIILFLATFCGLGSSLTALDNLGQIGESLGYPNHALASPLGSYILNVRVTGMLYDREAMKQLTARGLTRKDVKDLTCLGSQCYKLPFVILAAVTFFGALVALGLAIRTRKFYKGDIYKKFRGESHESESVMVSDSRKS
ncbi:hypothetical protein Bca52824_010144 [Brassica carinata]|uniref:Uncharacterized protein n=1 Tax=Brassica carinata TaxID=52824 RepID=A0A8X7WDD8_BRACI|nr:hypothetical protein Bca52824_010144 [Brassica carinata]